MLCLEYWQLSLQLWFKHDLICLCLFIVLNMQSIYLQILYKQSIDGACWQLNFVCYDAAFELRSKSKQIFI